jgi:hypothetical protein
MALDVAQQERDHRWGMWERLHRRPSRQRCAPLISFGLATTTTGTVRIKRGRVRRFSACKCVVEVMR